ncbi:RA-domain-containing protein [Westerdykella ornata]|uniref:RA-domain-containing protein n=1 Tax=Westerdykella ornata TaxID=318751 RepID=A0A6A6JUA1_WESOR|nr:RA-domain-containing protein [Westerdykella ornata]KAF2279957.1 RA-domain-containing protein [Westerdykella ornata]
MAYRGKYFEESDGEADDEYERTVIQSPTLPADYHDSSPTDSTHSTEHTPTTYTHSRDGKSSPAGLITEWTEEQVADFISDLGLDQYAETFIHEGINGEALVALQHAELKEIGMNSVGHRLTVLKAVYETKVKQDVPIDPDHYVPLSADSSAQDAPATQDDLSKVIRVIQARDERIQVAEAELRHLKDALSRASEENKRLREEFQEEYRRLREEFLPIARLLKDSQQPLPTPQEHAAPTAADQQRSGGLSRKFSTKKLFLGSAPKNPSPTIHEGRTMADSTSIDPSAAALAASSHLTASLPGGQQMSPNTAGQPSPTSPAYNQNRTYNRDVPPRSTLPDHENTPAWNQSWASESTAVGRDSRPTPAPLSNRPLRNNAQPNGTDDRDRDPPLSGNTMNVANPPSSAPSQPSGAPSVEIFKSFRVSIDDPCHKVLPVALKKYNITADWRQYALYIVHGDQERCLGLNERPLILFKQLDKEGRKPMFMLRKHAAPAEGHVSTIGGNDQRSVGSGGGVGWDGQNRGVQLPGGVL